VKQRYTISNGKIHQETRYKKQNLKKEKQNSKTYTNLFFTRTTMSRGIERLQLSPGTATVYKLRWQRKPNKITKKVDNKTQLKKAKQKRNRKNLTNLAHNTKQQTTNIVCHKNGTCRKAY
jgi:hypothetical protein